jgi:hypothetical protein
LQNEFAYKYKKPKVFLDDKSFKKAFGSRLKDLTIIKAVA